MKWIRFWASGLIAACLMSLVLCSAPPASAVDPGPSDVVQPYRHPGDGNIFYFLMTDRFADGDAGNNTAIVADNRQPTSLSTSDDPQISGYDPTDAGYFQGGDLKGVIDHLDYITNMGATAIWLTPPFVNKPVSQGSAGYHGYWITDFTHIDPHLGGDQAMLDLIDAAHAKGLKVFFDIVVNHTADTISYQGQSDAAPYVPLAQRPYTTSSGEPFDPARLTGSEFPALDAATSFPYVPYRPDPTTWLVPEQLNDLTWYHNRGEASLGSDNESTLYGDFAGLDDLMTERPQLADMFIDEMVTPWIGRGVDGFRIDTVKYVGLDFWARFSQGIEASSSSTNPGFLTFGEAYDSNVAGVVSPAMRQGGIDTMLDFPYAFAAQAYAQGDPGQVLADLFSKDAYYTTARTSPTDMVTFVDNHDMGRLCSMLAGRADAAERVGLAYTLTYLVRGQPVVYYGDEQGFCGTGGDKAAREPMFGPLNGTYDGSPYATSPLLGGGSIGADYGKHVYDTSVPFYQLLSTLAALRTDHPALVNGDQITLGAKGSVFAFSRVDPGNPVENLVAVNSSSDPATADVMTLTPGATYRQYYPETGSTLTADASGRLSSVTVPPYGAVVYEADRQVAAAGLDVGNYTASATDVDVNGRILVRATTPDNRWTLTSAYAIETGQDPNDDTNWVFLGTSTGPSPKVYADAADFPAGVDQIRTVTTDISGTVVATTVGEPATIVSTSATTSYGWMWVLVALGALAVIAVVILYARRRSTSR